MCLAQTPRIDYINLSNLFIREIEIYGEQNWFYYKPENSYLFIYCLVLQSFRNIDLRYGRRQFLFGICLLPQSLHFHFS
jgi:hypothetical protein